MAYDWIDSSVFALICFYRYAAPFTKVEESFNLQAIHDLVYHGTDLDSYDHFMFPGVVPRTFIGAIAVSLFLKPIAFFYPLLSKYDMQSLARDVIGLINATMIITLRHTIEKTCNANGKGRKLGLWYLFYQLIQFHVVYYASRTLPNMMVFPLTNSAICKLLYGNYAGALWQLSFCAAIFRSELAVLAGSFALALVVTKKITIPYAISKCFNGAVIGALLSLLVDSIFWRQVPMVPEVMGFIFNVVYGKSQEWGVEPFYTYFSQHLPNMITNPVLLGLVPAGAFEDPTGKNHLRVLALGALFYVCIYSLQPHKEWRFVIYVMPILALLSANGTLFAFARRKRALIYKIMPYIIVVSSIASFGVSLAKLGISAHNYPGGNALREFHEIVNITQPTVLHLDVPTCMTGASRFEEINPLITYDKTEREDRLLEVWEEFEYLITAHPDATVLPSVPGYEWKRIHTTSAFKTLNGQFIDKQVRAATSDIGYYLQSIFDRVRKSKGFKQDAQELWDELVLFEPKIFTYKKTRIGSRDRD